MAAKWLLSATVASAENHPAELFCVVWGLLCQASLKDQEECRVTHSDMFAKHCANKIMHIYHDLAATVTMPGDVPWYLLVQICGILFSLYSQKMLMNSFGEWGHLPACLIIAQYDVLDLSKRGWLCGQGWWLIFLFRRRLCHKLWCRQQFSSFWKKPSLDSIVLDNLFSLAPSISGQSGQECDGVASRGSWMDYLNLFQSDFRSDLWNRGSIGHPCGLPTPVTGGGGVNSYLSCWTSQWLSTLSVMVSSWLISWIGGW